MFVGTCILSVVSADEQPLLCSDRAASSSSFRGTTVRKNVALQGAQHVNGRPETELNVSFQDEFMQSYLEPRTLRCPRQWVVVRLSLASSCTWRFLLRPES